VEKKGGFDFLLGFYILDHYSIIRGSVGVGFRGILLVSHKITFATSVNIREWKMCNFG